MKRAGVAADAALLARAEAFLSARRISAAALARLPDARLRAWAAQLRAGLPTDYAWLMTGPALPLPVRAAPERVRALSAVLPAGAAARSLVVDLERALWYGDDAWPVYEDVCRASRTGALDAAARRRLEAVLAGAGIDAWRGDWLGELPVGGGRPVCLALALDAGVARYTALGRADAPEAFGETIEALFCAVGMA